MESVWCCLTLYSLNSPWTDFRSTGFQWMWAPLVSTFDTRRSVGASVGSEQGNNEKWKKKNQNTEFPAV